VDAVGGRDAIAWYDRTAHRRRRHVPQHHRLLDVLLALLPEHWVPGCRGGLGPGTTGTAWEIANSGPNSTTKPNILNAACRPATFLNYVRTSGLIWTSGGAGATAFALTWYNAGSILDKVLLENGPVFTDINRGCEVPNNQLTTVCAPGTAQTGCNTATWPSGNENVFDYSLEYINAPHQDDASSVNQWTGNAAANPTQPCGGSNPTNLNYTTPWTNMSIYATGQVVSGYTPSFNYPSTAMSAWLCQSLSNPGAVFNNSMAEGGLYYAQFTQQSQAANSLSVNGVVCPTTEDIEEGTTVYGGVSYNGQMCAIQGSQQTCNNAYGALEVDMARPSIQQAQTWPTACYHFRRN